MFCPACGKAIQSGKFCPHCGENLPSTSKDGEIDRENSKTTSQDGENSKKRPSTFSEFYAMKSKDRVNRFVFKKKKDKREAEEVLIHASLLQDISGKLTQDRGSRLPVKVDVSWDHVHVKKAIFEKFSRYNETVKDLKLEDVKLVYKNGEPVRYIPGTKIPFTVKGYKEDLGVRYNSLVLYLLPYRCFSSSDDDLPEVIIK